MQISLSESVLVAIEATKLVIQKALSLEPTDLAWVQADIDAHPFSPGNDGYDGHRHIEVRAITEHPSDIGYASFSADCTVSEKDGRWIPRSVNLWRVGTPWRRRATYHSNGTLEIKG